MKFFYVLVLACIVSAPCLAQSQGNRDGQIRQIKDSLTAWDDDKRQWVSIEQFWLAYAERRGGLSWGRGRDYPPYAQVNEFDTFLVETEHGPCLMEFFHSRWRRANDVRRWDERFNQYGGCPSVFD